MAQGTHTIPLSNFGSRTDIGCVRDHNEDSLVVIPPLFAVCDGMGGHEAGEVASEIAVTVLAENAPEHPDAEALKRAVEMANAEIIAAAMDGRGREGMGTTCTAAMIEGERLVVAQVGDSRAYLLHNGKLQQITRDHSLVSDMVESGQITAEEARVHPSRSIITRALGTAADTQPDIYKINVAAGDRLMLCSDGLSGMINDREISDVMLRVQDPQRCAAMLVNEAIAAGGLDNVTVIVVNIEGLAAKKRRKIALKTKIWAFFVLVLLAAIVGVAGYALSWWVNTAAFLGEDNGKVAVYQGVPDTFLGLTFNHLDHVSDVDISTLNPGLQQRIRDHEITADNIEAADALVAQYKEDLAGSNQQTPTPGTDSVSEAAATAASENTTNSAATNANANAAAAASAQATSVASTAASDEGLTPGAAEGAVE